MREEVFMGPVYRKRLLPEGVISESKASTILVPLGCGRRRVSSDPVRPEEEVEAGEDMLKEKKNEEKKTDLERQKQKDEMQDLNSDAGLETFEEGRCNKQLSG